MAKLNIILEAKAKDRGTRKYLRDLTKLADGYTESLDRAAAASRKMGDLPSVPTLPAGRDRGGRGRGGAARARGREDRPRRRQREPRGDARRARLEKDFDRALTASVKEARAQARAMDRQEKMARKAARNIENLSDAQLVEIETQKEINRRRRRAAKASAKESLGRDPTLKRGGSRLEFAENLSVVSGEFEQAGAQIEEGLRGSFDAFSSYEKSVAEVSTLTDDIPIDEITKITKGATAEFGGLPTDQVKAFYSIVSAGATTSAEAQEQLAFANKLAIGGVAEQEEAVLAISKSVANFKDQGVDSAQAADSLFTAVKRGQTTVAEMARALPAVAQAASDSGLSLDETNAAIAVLSTRFASAKEGATAMRQALANIAKPTKGAREEAKRLGIDFSTAGIEAAGGIEEFLLKLRAAEKFDENTLAKLFDSTEARAAVGGLINGMEDYRSVLADMENKQGATDTAFQKMSETSAQKAKQLEAQWELLKIQAGEALVPALQSIAEELGPFLSGITEFVKENPRVVSQLAKLAIGAAVFARGAGMVSSALSMWNALAGISMTKLGGLSGSVDKVGASAASTGKLAGGLQKTMGALPAVFVGAQVAILAFNTILDQARKPLEDYENAIKAVEEQQKKISFQDAEGEDKSEAELLLERRNRLIQVVNASRAAEAEARTGGVDDDANLFRKSIGGYSGLLNQVSGVQADLSVQRDQAERDLARFDEQFSQQIGLTEDQTFQREAGVFEEGGMIDMMRRNAEANERIAENTSGRQWWEGGSMEAGEV